MPSNRNISPGAYPEELDLDSLDLESTVPAEEAEYSLEEILAEFGSRRVREDAEAELEASKPQPVVLLTENGTAPEEAADTPEGAADMPEEAADMPEDMERAEHAAIIPVWKEIQPEPVAETESAPEPVAETESAPETVPETESTPKIEQMAESAPETEQMAESAPETEQMAESAPETGKTKAAPLLEPVKLFSLEDFENFPEAEAADIEWRAAKIPPLESLVQAAREMRETLYGKARQVKARFSRNKSGAAENISNTAEARSDTAESAAQSAAETRSIPAQAGSPAESAAQDAAETRSIPAQAGSPAESDAQDAAETRNIPETSVPEGESPPVQVEEIVENTVDAVMAERYQISWSPRAFFSQQDTDSLYAPVSEEKEPVYAASEEAGPADVSGPNLKTAANIAKAEYRKRTRDFPAALLSTLPPALFLFSEWIGARISLLYNNAILRAFLMLICLIASIWFCRQAFTAGRRCTSAFLCGLCALAASADCLIRLFSAARSPADSYGAVACLALICAKWGVSLESRGQFDTLRTAALDKAPPYLVTTAENGARKQRGAVPGFYTFASAQNFSSRWQTLLLPLVLAASLVFAALSSAGQDRPWDFFLNWSAILCAGATFTLPLCWGLPWARLARRMNNVGCAVAGWDGAEHISRGKNMVVTDQDLFPPGSIQINGMKIYNEDLEKVVSYAASMASASGCGLRRVFDDLLRSELGHYLPVDNFQFYQEGGFSGIIGGENVLFGTESFLMKMGLHLPDHPRFFTGVFLAVQGELTAAFAIHYQAAENVDFALRLMRRGHVAAILATRDPNITPKLLQRKFHRKLKWEFPSLASRIALSETSKKRHLPRALLFREGLLPYAEAVVGSRRLCRGVRRATLLSLFGSAAGTVLAFYLAFEGRYNLLTPLTLILFLLLWMLPALLMMELT